MLPTGSDLWDVESLKVLESLSRSFRRVRRALEGLVLVLGISVFSSNQGHRVAKLNPFICNSMAASGWTVGTVGMVRPCCCSFVDVSA